MAAFSSGPRSREVAPRIGNQEELVRRGSWQPPLEAEVNLPPGLWSHWLISLHGGHLCTETGSMLGKNCLGVLAGLGGYLYTGVCLGSLW